MKLPDYKHWHGKNHHIRHEAKNATKREERAVIDAFRIIGVGPAIRDRLTALKYKDKGRREKAGEIEEEDQFDGELEAWRWEKSTIHKENGGFDRDGGKSINYLESIEDLVAR